MQASTEQSKTFFFIQNIFKNEILLTFAVFEKSELSTPACCFLKYQNANFFYLHIFTIETRDPFLCLIVDFLFKILEFLIHSWYHLSPTPQKRERIDD